jgi:hypothetical protein
MNKQTEIEWLFKQLWEEPKDKMVWYAILDKAKEMKKEQMEEIREMLVQGALTNMSCASAVVEFDRLTKQQEQ